MKKSLLSLLAAFVAFAATAQCDKIFISEYVVGSGNNKAYELYNPTDQPIDLDGYIMERWSNGQGYASDSTVLAGIIPAHGTWVVTNGQTEDIDLGSYISPACDPELQALADQLDMPYPAPTFMNGNDALVLFDRSGTTPVVLDIFGKPGEDPGEAWAAPDGTYITDRQTMVRKFEITGGVTFPPVTFQPLLEYDTLGRDNWTNLGIHDCECFPLSTGETESLDVQMYPNPATPGTPINVRTNRPIVGVEIYDVNGRKVASSIQLTNPTEGQIDISELKRGTYIVNVLMERTGFSTRIVVE